MAERIVSPGVFTREKDLSFLPQAIGEIGAAIIGPTKKGPAFTPTQVSNFQEFEEMFGGVDNRFYTPYTVEQYLRSAGTVTVVRVLGLGGYKVDSLELLAHGLGQPTRSVAILAPSRGSSGTGDLEASTMAAGASWSSFTLTVSGSDVSAENYSLSFDTSSANFVSDVISSDPQSTKSGGNSSSVYVYKLFKNFAMNTSGSGTSAISASVLVTSDGFDFQGGATSFNSKGNQSSFTGNKDYMFARTPVIHSQRVGGQKYSLFRVYSRSHGTEINTSYKIKILSVKSADDIAGSDYGQFSLHVVDVGNENVLEEFDNLTLDPASPSYFAKRIGDRWVEIDSNGKLTYYGSYPNLSKFIRVGDFSDMEEDGVFRFPKSVVPFGHAAVKNPSPGATRIPSASFKTTQTDANGTLMHP